MSDIEITAGVRAAILRLRFRGYTASRIADIGGLEPRDVMEVFREADQEIAETNAIVPNPPPEIVQDRTVQSLVSQGYKLPDAIRTVELRRRRARS